MKPSGVQTTGGQIGCSLGIPAPYPSPREVRSGLPFLVLACVSCRRVEFRKINKFLGPLTRIVHKAGASRAGHRPEGGGGKTLRFPKSTRGGDARSDTGNEPRISRGRVEAESVFATRKRKLSRGDPARSAKAEARGPARHPFATHAHPLPLPFSGSPGTGGARLL